MFGSKKLITPAQEGRQVIRDTMWSLLDKEPFFAHIALGLKLVADDKINTLSTNGSVLKYNPKMVIERYKSDPAEFEAIICHEILHVAYMHPWRCGERDEKLWNVAADETVNAILRQHKFKVGRDWVNLGLAQGRTTEQIYEYLKQGGAGGKSNKPDQFGMMEKPDPNGEPGDGNPEDGDGQARGYKTAEDVEYDAKKAIMDAAALAKEAGKMPGDLVSIIKDINQSERDWRDLVRRIAGEGSSVTQSWSRPNRRYIGDGEYLPGALKEGVNNAAILIDTSGSVDDNLVAKFIGEARKIVSDIGAERTSVACIDTRVQWSQDFGMYEDIDVVVKGRGGTAFSPAFKWIEERGLNPRIAVYLTDLECSDYGPKPDYPVVWVVFGGGGTTPPWGETVRI